MLTEKKSHPLVKELENLIEQNNWKAGFEKAIKLTNSKNVPLLEEVKNLKQYLNWINEFLCWIPEEDSTGEHVNNYLSAFYFMADQEPVFSLQNKVLSYNKGVPSTLFSEWLVTYAKT